MIKLKELREERGLTQAQLAQAIGVNHRTISQYEKGTNEPNVETIKKLCKYFDISSDYLLGINEY